MPRQPSHSYGRRFGRLFALCWFAFGSIAVFETGQPIGPRFGFNLAAIDGRQDRAIGKMPLLEIVAQTMGVKLRPGSLGNSYERVKYFGSHGAGW